MNAVDEQPDVATDDIPDRASSTQTLESDAREPGSIMTDLPPADLASLPIVLDGVGAAAVELARAAAVEFGEGAVGEYRGAHAEAELVVAHVFAAQLLGYSGWHWAVTVVRTADSDRVTVDEVVLLPGEGALLAPAWVPWSERMRPGDLSPGDLVPSQPDDPRLVPAYVLGDDPAEATVAFELGLGRVRVMSREGRLDAADRWYTGAGGPDSEMARLAPGNCGTCGFLLALAGSLSAGFGVCGNEIALADGRVVSVEHGCGAHSEAVLDVGSLAEPVGEIYDDGEEIIRLTPVRLEGEPEVGGPEVEGAEVEGASVEAETAAATIGDLLGK